LKYQQKLLALPAKHHIQCNQSHPGRLEQIEHGVATVWWSRWSIYLNIKKKKRWHKRTLILCVQGLWLQILYEQNV